MKKRINLVYSSHLGSILNDEFEEHVKNTIGCEHTINCVENYNNYSLAEIYNEYLTKDGTEDTVFVFCHPDIIFKTKNWGMRLLTHFNTTNYGIIGVAGTSYLAKTGKWWEDQTKLIGIVNHTDGKREWASTYSKPFNGIRDAVTIDGVFMSIDPFKIMHGFDEKYGKFHFYDVSFCVPNYLDGVNIGVTTSFRILHKSIGELNQDWEINRVKFSEEYKEDLPIALDVPYEELNIKIPINEKPKVSVIIPTKNNFEYLYDNILSWKEKVKYDNYEIIIADTGSDDETLKKYDDILKMSWFGQRIKLVKYDYYNFAKINNDVVKNHTDGELVLFCNDDIELLNDALSRCVEIYNQNKHNAGTIGIRLHFGDSSIQHCGILIYRDVNDNLLVTHKNFKETYDYPTKPIYNSIGNTAAFLLINKDLFLECGCFNENYIECLEDVELNFKCLIKKKKNITACDAVAYHYESVTREKDTEKNNRTTKDFIERLQPFYDENKPSLKKHFKKYINQQQQK